MICQYFHKLKILLLFSVLLWIIMINSVSNKNQRTIYRGDVTTTRKVTSHYNQIKCDHPGCDISFTSEQTKSTYIKDSHPADEKFYCSQSGCDLYFGNREIMLLHRRDNHHIKCDHPGCDASFTSEQTKSRRIKDFHPADEKFYCSQSGCDLYFDKRDIMMLHRRDNHHIKCDHPGCDASFTSEETKSRHIKEFHPANEKFYCSQSGCDLYFDKRDIMMLHRRDVA
jgi:hypothetical protein